MEIFDLLALLVILLAFLWPLAQAFLLRRADRKHPEKAAKRREASQELERKQYREVYRALYGEQTEEEIQAEPVEVEPEPEPEQEIRAVGTSELTDIDTWELAYGIEEADIVSERFVGTEAPVMGTEAGNSRIQTLLVNLPSRQDMILLHEILGTRLPSSDGNSPGYFGP